MKVRKQKKKKQHIATIRGLERALAAKPYYVVRFRTGKHDGVKDKPRDKNWRKWDTD